MRILHTSDWHLGHTLHGSSRTYEHQCFLKWLLETLKEQDVDALLIAGDIFDSANPPAPVWRAWYRLLADVRQLNVQVIVTGGNHDSAARLEAPRPLLDALNIKMVGGIPQHGRNLDVNAMALPILNKSGEVQAWCAAMPFIRMADIPPMEEEPGKDRLIEGVRELYTQLLDHILSQAQPNQAVIAMGHCYMTGTKISSLSERKVLGGNLHALPANIFPNTVDYVALGHLHKPQKVGGYNHIRYCGAPIPLSLKEKFYEQQVCLVDFEEGRLKTVQDLPIPRFVLMMQAPKGPLEEVLAYIQQLEPLNEDEPEEVRPFLDVTVQLKEPQPNLRRSIEDAMAGKRPRLLKIETEYAGHGRTLADQPDRKPLKELDEKEVFLGCWQRYHEGQPSDELLALFSDLVSMAHEVEL